MINHRSQYRSRKSKLNPISVFLIFQNVSLESCICIYSEANRFFKVKAVLTNGAAALFDPFIGAVDVNFCALTFYHNELMILSV